MRMMKNNRNETIMVIGIDHGYGNMKTATRCFPSGVARYDKEPIFQNNLLVYNGMYYQIGEEHKEFCAEKTQDEDYYVLTLAAIAKELDGKGMNRAKVHIAAGLPLTWVATQKEDFQKYLLQNERVDFTFRNKEYHVEFAGADIYPQGFAAAFYRLQDFKGINMLADIGNGTMNIMYINNSRPLEKKCFTEKYGTHQCVLAVRESLLKELGTVVDDLVIEQVIRTGTADIGEKYLTVIRKAAGDYTKEIFHKLREREYNPELMRLYVVGGGGCMIQNFGEYDKTYRTHYEAKYKKYAGGKIVIFVQDNIAGMNIDTTTLSTSYRNNQIICDLANQMYPDMKPCDSAMNEKTGHDGIFWVHENDIDKYVDIYNPVQLRYDKRTKVNPIPKTMNFGLSKGLTFNRVLIYPTKPMLDWLSGKSKDMKDESLSKFYVAVTRARYSVAFVYKTKRLPTNDIGTKWTPDVLE